MLGEDAAVVILLFVLWRVDGETLGSVGHLLIGNRSRRYGLQGVNPGVANTITELFLLSPGNFSGQHVGKGFAHNLLLHRLTWAHLRLRIGAHGNV